LVAIFNILFMSSLFAAESVLNGWIPNSNVP